MPADFDPYRKWLGIPPEDQPPNHYRLLGLGLFESDVDAISNAADRQMSHVRTFQSGPHSAISQQLLNELSAARVCLLNPSAKSEYDRGLRSRLNAAAAANPPQSPPPSYAAAPGRAFEAPAPRPLGAGGRPRSSSASAGLGEYGLGPPKTISRTTLRRPARPQSVVRTAQIGAAAAAAALVFLAAVYALTKTDNSPQPDTVADATIKDAASGRNSPDDAPIDPGPSEDSGPNGKVTPRAAAETASSGDNRSQDQKVELPEIVQIKTQTFNPDQGDFARADGRAFAARPNGFVGLAAVGFEIKAIGGLNVETSVKGELRAFAEDPANSFAGYMVDYHTADGYTHRVALPLGLSSPRRNSGGPDLWGKAAAPDRYVDLAIASIVHLNLSDWAPEGWDGRIWFSAVIQNSGPGTAIEGRLIDLIGPDGASSPMSTAPATAQPETSPVSPAVRRQFDDLTRKLNDLASWKVLAGQWSQRDGGIVGKGDSRLEFGGELPADCRLSFEMNVLDGMRPRIFFFGDRNFHFGNEGYEHTLFIHGEGQAGGVGKQRPYANGETLEVECRFAGHDVEFIVNGQLVVRARSKHAGPLKMTISGGDFWSAGQTLFRRFKLDPLPAGSGSPPSATVDLLKGIDPKRDAVLGDWSFEGDALLTAPLEGARLQIPVEPLADYELRLTVQAQPQNNGALFIGLMVGGHQTSVAIDGWDGQTSGMHMLDGAPAGFNSSKRQGRVFTDAEPKEIVCTVHPASVLARCGEQTIVDWRGDPAKLSMEPRLEVPNKRQLFLAGWNGRFLIRKLELRPLPPEAASAASVAPPPVPTDNPNPPPAAPDAREPIPDPALVREAARKVEARYQNDWRRAKKLADRLGMPPRMIDDSRGAEAMPMRYALLREAADRAAGMGDAGATSEAFDELEKHFRVDALADRLEAVRQAVLKLHDASQAWTAIMTALSLADLAVRSDRLDLADGFVDSAALAAKKSANLAVRQVVRERTAAVARRKHDREKYEEARQRLKANPDDAGANLSVGRYECFYLGRWEQGLPRLAKSSDATLAKLAALEKTAATDPSQRAALAKAWQAAAAQAGADQEDYLLEANYWRLRSLGKPASQPAAAIGLARAEPGLNAVMFNGADFQQEVVRRVDPFLRKNFGFGSPDPKIGGDNFSIRWTGWLKPPLAGKYVLHASADDGFRLWLDGKKLLDRWGGAGDESKEVDLTTGLHALKIEYNEYGATAGVRLGWKLRDLSTDFTVPGAVLFHDTAGIAESLEAK